MRPPFDTKEWFETLSNQGLFTEPQAETLTDFLKNALSEIAALNVSGLATKDDLREVRDELAAKMATKEELQEVKDSLEARISTVQANVERLPTEPPTSSVRKKKAR